MRVRAVDIAERLGISKATVSLALNGKPGVSEGTREAVLKCREELEAQLNQVMADGTVEDEVTVKSEPESALVGDGLMIKVIIVDRKLGIVCDSALNVWTEVLRIFDTEARKRGYTIGITYIGMDDKEIQRAVEECASPMVAGVLLFATEMDEKGFDWGFRAIRKPMVSFDHDVGNRHHSIVIDNEAGVEKAVEFLVSRGCRRIEYLAQKISIYNFERRRVGFCSGVRKMRLDVEQCPVVPVGTSIESVAAFMEDWLKDHTLPDAFLMENYQISIGTLKALKSLWIQVPGQVSLLGVDELPSYMTGDKKLNCLKIAHEDRAYVAIKLLMDEIEQESRTKFKVASRCEMILGDTVR